VFMRRPASDGRKWVLPMRVKRGAGGREGGTWQGFAAARRRVKTGHGGSFVACGHDTFALTRRGGLLVCV
jgi:hypothetical protein